jgi:hypothetical protein
MNMLEQVPQQLSIPPTCPFAKSTQLVSDLDILGDNSTVNAISAANTSLPGNPRIKILDDVAIRSYVYKDLWAEALENLAPRLWFLSTQSHLNVSALHHQVVKGRTIVLTEDPGLHLVWFHSRIYIKPLPKYLMSFQFWSRYLQDGSPIAGQERKRIVATSLGFLRTYYHLIKHESDFNLAQENKLLPATATFEQFCNFSTNFHLIQDGDVSERYTYGEIRLTRLNFYAKLFLGKVHFYRVQQYNDFFTRFFGPLLFVFAIFSVMLSAMQLEMTVEQLTSNQWVPLWDVCRWFSLLSILVTVVSCLSLAFMLLWMILREWNFALREHTKRKRREAKSVPF